MPNQEYEIGIEDQYGYESFYRCTTFGAVHQLVQFCERYEFGYSVKLVSTNNLLAPSDFGWEREKFYYWSKLQ